MGAFAEDRLMQHDAAEADGGGGGSGEEEEEEGRARQREGGCGRRVRSGRAPLRGVSAADAWLEDPAALAVEAKDEVPTRRGFRHWRPGANCAAIGAGAFARRSLEALESLTAAEE